MQNLNHLFDCFRQFINFLARIVESKRSARGCRNTEKLHHGLRAVMSGANGDALLVKDRADVVRMNVFDRERQNGCFFLRRADNAHAFDCRKFFGRVFEQFVFIAGGGFKINRIQIINRRAESDVGGDGGRSGFKFSGIGA